MSNSYKYRVYLGNELFPCILETLATVRNLRDKIWERGCSNAGDLVLSVDNDSAPLSNSDTLLYQNFGTDQGGYYVVHAYVPLKFQISVDGIPIDIVTTSNTPFGKILEAYNLQGKLELHNNDEETRINLERTAALVGIEEGAILYLTKEQ